MAVILGILAASAGELVHACAMGFLPEAEAPAEAAMPCHGGDKHAPQAAGHAMDMDPSGDAMDCCDDAGPAPGACIDCLCTAVSMPLSALETVLPQASPAPTRHALPLSAAPPPERPPEYLLRPPISVS